MLEWHAKKYNKQGREGWHKSEGPSLHLFCSTLHTGLGMDEALYTTFTFVSSLPFCILLACHPYLLFYKFSMALILVNNSCYVLDVVHMQSPIMCRLAHGHKSAVMQHTYAHTAFKHTLIALLAVHAWLLTLFCLTCAALKPSLVH